VGAALRMLIWQRWQLLHAYGRVSLWTVICWL
jgi:hypothetical protein